MKSPLLSLAVLGVTLVLGLSAVLLLPSWVAALILVLLLLVLGASILRDSRQQARRLEVLLQDLEEARVVRPVLATTQAETVAPQPGPEGGGDDWFRVRFEEAADFASLSLRDSEEFARSQVQLVLQGFRSLGDLTMSIETGVAETFRSLLDGHSTGTLGAIVGESEAMVVELKDFFSLLSRLQDQTRGYLRTNTAELVRVREIAETIEDFFENIRMISLNLSIEASRIGNSAGGKALQVLAQKLREFSGRAQELSAEQKLVITNAEGALSASEAQVTVGFDRVTHRIVPLQKRMESFPPIIADSHARLDAVVADLSRLSAAVQSLLKGEIGELQFQDLSRQEHEHLAELLVAWSRKVPNPSSGPSVTAERLAMAREFNARISTNNERRVLLAWMDQHGIPRDSIDVKGSDQQAGSVVLF